jgi:hypothetical protein
MDWYGALMASIQFGKRPHLILKIKLKIKSTPIVTIPVTRQWHEGEECRKETTFMMVRKLKFAAVAAISLLGLSFEAAPATAGGCWYDGCGSAVIVQPVPVYPSCSCCSCGSASYGLGYYGGYDGGYGLGYYGGYGGGYGPGYYGGYGGGYGPGYYGGYRRAAYGGYRGGLYRRGAFGGYRGGLYRRAAYGGYRGGLYRRGY